MAQRGESVDEIAQFDRRRFADAIAELLVGGAPVGAGKAFGCSVTIFDVDIALRGGGAEASKLT